MTDTPSTDSEPDASTTAITSTWKVLGKLEDAAATGVLGQNTSTTGQTTGVEGLVDSAGIGSAGLRGTATAGSGEVFGVQGVNQSTDNLSAAIDGYAPNGGSALIAEADQHWAGWVHTNEPGAVGLWGANEATSGDGVGIHGYTESEGGGSTGVKGSAFALTGETYGVRGTVDSAQTNSTGVYGSDATGSGETYGVRGVTRSDNANAAGVLGESTGSDSPAVMAKGDLEVTGSVSATEIGIDVYLGSDLSVNDSETRVVFDQVRHDDLGEYDPSTGEFTPARDGAFLITAQVDWDGASADEGDEYFLSLHKNGANQVLNNSAYSSIAGPSQQINHVMRGLTSTDTVTIDANSNSSDGTTNVTGGAEFSWFQVSKIA